MIKGCMKKIQQLDKENKKNKLVSAFVIVFNPFYGSLCPIKKAEVVSKA